MTFEPILAWWVFLLLAGLTLALRMYTLYRVLVVVGKGSQRKVVVRWSLLTLVIVCLFAAAVRPGIEGNRHPVSQAAAAEAANSNVNVFFVVDRSLNSRAEDFGNNQFRMAGVRSDMQAIVDQYPAGRFSITSFATKARVDWPLSDDVWSLRALLKDYSAYESDFDSVYQVDVGAAGDQLKRQLQLGAQQYPGSNNLVFYLGEGAGISKQTATEFDIPAGLVAGGAVLGYGTAAGGRVASRLAANGEVTYFPDPTGGGGQFLSALDEASLRTVAEQLHVPYFHRGLGDSTSTIIPGLDEKSSTAVQQEVSMPGDRTEFYWIFTAIAMLLMFYELFAMAREYRVSRMTRLRGQ
ncbi:MULTISPECIES: VWA domain-containing protein [unclassified Mycolicibacterium]|uniref:vWA domain-containing protein n=1 Tax=unclassified Mycolicibacterium TaxID=2636767 RepID=UPI0012DD15DC|nr:MULTISPECIES: VWA domain-containing protein [unclassified Mycolicibacterium]MUL81795.1 VWA domain-containing protein [Mycolicibacterium sp. CBMA 329]MUL87561.1 VWA domain-containing protein [Mycolicibacterium sp. CBMA 331]MUL99575.1 VWA domain-containing protein [Mycolicibacterium sp. CBMA 334]MUM37858.1 VWA domain-containing protein [Mycolicibacterium sp. CBMA 247]MUM43626.1 VWA domain-containing protein [Mycolicibacterium sp. CBMA 294]